MSFHSSEANERLAIGSNRSGKTTCGVVEDIWWATGTHPYLDTPRPPVSIRCVCTDFVNGIQKTILPKFKEYLRHTDLLGGSWSKAYSKEFRTLHFDKRFGDTFIEFMSYDQDVEKFGGPPRHLVHYDEPPPYDIYMECQARLVDYGGKSFCTFTPINLDARTSWIYQLWKDANKGTDSKLSCFFFDIYKNVHLPKGFVDDFAKRIRGEGEYLARVKGKFPRLAGRIYPDLSRERHVIRPFKIPADWSWYIAADPHTRKETAAVVAVVDREGVVYIVGELLMKAKAKVILDVIRQSLGRNKLAAAFMDDQSKAPNQYLDGRSIWQEFIDPDRDGSNKGIFFIPVSGRHKDVIPGLRRVNDYLGLDTLYDKPRLFIFDTCVQTIEQLEGYVWEDYKHKIDAPVMEKPHKVKDDLCDCVRYLLMGDPVYVKPRSDETTDYKHPYPYMLGGGHDAMAS